MKNATGVAKSDFAKKIDLANLKSDVDIFDIDNLENVPSNKSNLKSKVDKSDVDKLLPASIDLIKLSYVVKRIYIALKSKMLKMKYLILLT